MTDTRIHRPTPPEPFDWLGAIVLLLAVGTIVLGFSAIEAAWPQVLP